MAHNRVTSLRSRLSHAALGLFARVAYRKPEGLHRARQNESVARILVLEPWNIGDVILAMPFLAQLRSLFPRARITLLAQPFAADLLAGTGLVDEFPTAELTWTPADRLRLPSKTIDLWRLSRKLRAQRFDVAFSARLHVREHILLALSRAERRVGFAFGSHDAALTDAVSPGDSQRHRVGEWMRLLEPFGGASSVEVPRLYVERDERSWASEFLTSRGIANDELLIGIHPGASLAEKRWPLEQFSEVATAIVAQPGIRVLAFADPVGYGSELFAIPRVVGAQVGLRKLVALVEQCSLLVCNDSGPMHIAGALGVPTVALFGQGIEEWFAPLGDGHEMLRPDRTEPPFGSSPTAAGIRSPVGISSAQVLDAVAKAVRRLRGGATLLRE